MATDCPKGWKLEMMVESNMTIYFPGGNTLR